MTDGAALLPWRKRSPRPLLLASLVLMLVSWLLLDVEGTAHWAVLSSAISLQTDVKILRDGATADHRYPNGLTTIENLDAMETKLERIMKAGHRYMAIGSFRIVTGVASFGFALAAFFRRPRWMAWVALPSGILGLLMAVVIM